jgi:hypothetical protein
MFRAPVRALQNPLARLEGETDGGGVTVAKKFLNVFERKLAEKKEG